MTLLVKNLSCYLSGRKIFSDISFSLKTGEILKISGENGSGKTTLLRVISGLSSFESGEILINKKEIFLLGHNTGIKQNLTVEEDLEFWSNFYQNEHDDKILKKLSLNSKIYSQCRGILNAVLWSRTPVPAKSTPPPPEIEGATFIMGSHSDISRNSRI